MSTHAVSGALRADLDKKIAEFTLQDFHFLPLSQFDAEQRARFDQRFEELRRVRDEDYARRLAAMTDEAFANHEGERSGGVAYQAELKSREAKRAKAQAQAALDERVLTRAEKERCAELGLDLELLPLTPAARAEVFKAVAAEIDPAAPEWIRVLGVDPKFLKYLNRQTRRAALRRLVNKAEFMMQIELQQQKEDPEQEDYTPFWDPIDEVARKLEIGRTALSAFSKELTGLTVAYLADRLRAKAVKQKFKTALRAFVRELAASGGEPFSADDAWHKLNAARKKGRNHSLSSQSVALGFSSYARFYRACLALHRKTPGEIEYEVLAECVREFFSGEALAPEAPEPTLVETQNEFKRRWPPDPWRRAEAERSA